MGVLNGRVPPGDSFAVVGAFPLGLAAIATAVLFVAARVVAIELPPPDSSAPRLRRRRQGVRTIRGAEEQGRQADRRAGPDVAIEAVGIPEIFQLCTAWSDPAAANVGSTAPR